MSESVEFRKGSRLSHCEFRSLYVRIHKVLEKQSLSGTRADAFFEAFEAFSQAVDESMRCRRSIKAYDLDADRAWIYLMAQARTTKLHYEAVHREAGEKVYKIISSFGNITRHPYNVEYAEMLQALNQLEALDPVILKNAFVDDIVTHLHDCYDAFIQAQSDETAHQASFQYGIVKSTREALVAAWGKLAAWLDVRAEDDPGINQAIIEINNIDLETTSKRSGRKPEADQNPEDSSMGWDGGAKDDVPIEEASGLDCPFSDTPE